MNNNTQAQKGFQTFILTLSVSLIIFSVIYYFVTNLDKGPELSRDITQEISQEVKSYETVSVNPEEEEVETGFKQLASQEMNVPRRAVLSGATEEMDSGTEETTESTPVPSSGIFSLTVGLVSSVVLFVLAGWVIRRGPRHLALNRFEKQFYSDRN